MDRSNIR